MDKELSATKARADQQFAHVNSFLDEAAITQARKLLAEHGDATEAWTVLSERIARRLGCTTKAQRAAAKLLAAAAIRLAQHDADTPA